MRQSGGLRVRFGCKGIKVRVAGRLNGAKSPEEWYLQGRLPLQNPIARTSILVSPRPTQLMASSSEVLGLPG